MSSKPKKPFCAFRSGYSNFHIWDKKYQCNAFMTNGKPTIRCPEYKKKKSNLELIINKISDKEREPNKTGDLTRIIEDRPAFLRRNTKKVRYYKPNFNEKKNTFFENLTSNLKVIQKEFFNKISKHYFHLETFHGYDTFVLPTFEPKNNQLLNSYIKKHKDDDLESRISQVDRWLEDSSQYESGYVDVDEIVETRTRTIYRSNAMSDLRQINSSTTINNTNDGPEIVELSESNDENQILDVNSTLPLAIKPRKRNTRLSDITPNNIAKKKKVLNDVNTPIRRSSRFL